MIRKEPAAVERAVPQAAESTATPRAHGEPERYDLGRGELVIHKSHGEAVFHADERAKTAPSAAPKGEKR